MNNYIAHSTIISVTQGAILSFFAPQGQQVAQTGVKFGVEESTNWCTGGSRGGPKTENVTQNSGYKRLAPKVDSSMPNFTPLFCFINKIIKIC